MQFSGIVGTGKGEGKKIGFPTANIPLEDTSVSGIYAGVAVVEGKEYASAVYADQKRKLLEAHLLNFSGDLYGKELTITLGEKIREDAMFTDTESLKGQIEKDIETIREIKRTI